MNCTQREEHNLSSQVWASHICHEGSRASPQGQDVRAQDGSKIKKTHTFYWLFLAKFHCQGLLKDRSIFVALHMPGKLPISPPTAVSTLKYQQQSLQIAQNTRISAVFLTEVLPKLFSQRCRHITYPMAMQDEIVMKVKENSRKF